MKIMLCPRPKRISRSMPTSAKKPVLRPITGKRVSLFTPSSRVVKDSEFRWDGVWIAEGRAVSCPDPCSLKQAGHQGYFTVPLPAFLTIFSTSDFAFFVNSSSLIFPSTKSLQVAKSLRKQKVKPAASHSFR